MTTPDQTQKSGFNLTTAGLMILPLIALGVVIAIFLTTGGGLSFEAPAPVEAVSVERTILDTGHIELVLRNGSPQDVTIAQASVNAAVMPFKADPSPTIPRLGSSKIMIPYEWVEGEAYAITLHTTNAVAIPAEIAVATRTAQPTGRTFLGFTLIGLYVGVIPVYLGLFWFPALRRLGKRAMVFLLALTIGLLIFLGLDAISEGLEQAAHVSGSFQGIGLIGIGAVATFMLLDAIGQRQVATGRSDSDKRLQVAFLIAVGIGLHNLGEGLAIGAAYNLGEIALGTFLVVGFIVQNITEGLGIIAPVVRDRPSTGSLALMGFIGGAPAIAGAWIGGFTPSPVLAVLFLGIGAGAVFEVAYEITRLLRKDTESQPMPMTIFVGVITGMLLLWGTGLLIK